MKAGADSEEAFVEENKIGHRINTWQPQLVCPKASSFWKNR